MKKNLFVLAAVFLMLTTFFSCKKEETVLQDDCGCFIDIADAIKNAESENKNILLMVTKYGEDYTSQIFVDNIVNTSDFDDLIGSKYTICHLDFSASSYAKIKAADSTDKKQVKEADRYNQAMQTGYEFVSLLGCQYTPALYLLTKEGYVIADVDSDEQLNVEILNTLLDSYAEDCKKVNSLVEKSKNGSNLEKVRAIDELYERTAEPLRKNLYPLVVTVPGLDPNNESGVIGKYIVIAGEQDVVNFMYQNDPVGAAQKYLSMVKSEYISDDDKMDCYFNAAYFLSMTGAATTNEIKNLLQTGLSINPESPKAINFLEALEYYNRQEAEETYAANNISSDPGAK